MPGARFGDKQKQKIDQDKITAANHLYFENKLPHYKIKQQLQLGSATLDRILLPTFQEWREYRKRWVGM